MQNCTNQEPTQQPIKSIKPIKAPINLGEAVRVVVAINYAVNSTEIEIEESDIRKRAKRGKINFL